MIENEVDAFEPDLVLFQIQGVGDVVPSTIHRLRELYPETIFCNFNGDVRNEVEQVLVDVAKECHLTLLPSPDLFEEYHTRGADNVAYWPIAVDPEYLAAQRDKRKEFDVVFLGSHYPSAKFPLVEERYKIVEALHNSDLRFGLFGFGWPDEWKARYTGDDTPSNIAIYESAKLAISVSQFDLWGYTSDRLYRICATGCTAAIKAYKGMAQNGFIDGENCYTFDGHSTVVDVCRAALADDATRESIGEAGRQLILDRHNYDRRVDELLLMLERIE
jgi:spore maturation protein CgeB